MKRVLFICSRNRLFSPTAERVFAGRPGLEVASVGTAPDAEEPVTGEHLASADLVFAMEEAHRAILGHRFRPFLGHACVICLDIPDRYGFMDPDLVGHPETQGGAHLRGAEAARLLANPGRPL